MKVILLDNIRGVGQVGDVKEVSDGYARNFLYARKLARPVSSGVIKDIESLKAKKLQALELAKDEAQKLATKLTGAKINLSGKANEQGKLFAVIEKAVVVEAVSKLAGAKIDDAQIILKDQLKTVGQHEIDLELAEGITVLITAEVTAA